jgi:hypothetical protein
VQFEPVLERQIHAACLERNTLQYSHNQTQRPQDHAPAAPLIHHSQTPSAVLPTQELIGSILRILLHHLDEKVPLSLIRLVPNSFGEHLHQHPCHNTRTRSWQSCNDLVGLNWSDSRRLCTRRSSLNRRWDI